ncbi:MAG: hypothetical protein JWO41_416 [Candidatus Saccharibacteria bacterium]|nr:hypothetical protein [Candidatus Saccharibacteria bacterium]
MLRALFLYKGGSSVSGFEAIDNDADLMALNRDAIFPFAGQNVFGSMPLKPWPEQWAPSAEFPTPQSVGGDEFSQVANDAYSFHRAPAQYRLGESTLPVAPYREHFLDVVARNQSTVVSSETGSGKSSQLGLYLLEAGASRVFVTQPRIIATRELAERARFSLGPDYKNLAGYLTGNAADSDCSPEAQLVYVTEHLLFKMANRGDLNPDDVVISDEAHERTAPTDFFLGRMKELQQDNPYLRLIVSSATINTDKFARYLAHPLDESLAPVLILPGRTHPIKHIETDESVVDAVRRYMDGGKNVLAFEPGVTRMKKTHLKAQSRRSEHTVHLLYGDQSPTEQKAALNPDDSNHIIATRIGETSITPLGKDVVIDSGLSNVGGYKEGVRSLTTVFSSKDTMYQRRGRVGRTKPGVYVQAVPDEAPPPPLYEDRPDYEDPAIQNSSVASFIAELLSQGRRVEDLDLIDRPNPENLKHDYLVLKRLGAITINGDAMELTAIGEAIINLPLDVSLARMVVEARRIEFGDDAEHDRDLLILQVAAVAAIQQVNGILDGGQLSSRRYLKNVPNKERFSNEQLSDVLFELDVFATLFKKQQEAIEKGPAAEAQFDRFLIINDILPNRYYKAVRTFEELARREGVTALNLEKPDGEQRQRVLECQIAGAEEIFVRRSKRMYHDIRGDSRTMGRKSVLAVPAAQLVMGSAFDFSGMRSNGRQMRRFISGASLVTLEQLRERTPHRLTERSSGYAISRKGTFVEKKTFFFDGELNIGDIEETPSPTRETRDALVRAMMTGAGPSAQNLNEVLPYKPGTPNATQAINQWQSAQKLEHRAGVNLNIAKRYESLIKKIVRESLDTVPLDVTKPEQLDHLIPRIYLSSLVRPTRKKHLPEIIRKSPDALHVDGEQKEYIPINYKNNIAYITLTRDQLSLIGRDNFVGLLQNHDVKLRIGTGKYQHFDAAFTRIDEILKAKAEKKERRERDRQMLTEAKSVTNNPPVERKRPPMEAEVKEARIKGINMRAFRRRQRRTAKQLAMRGSTGDND